jgi:arginase
MSGDFIRSLLWRKDGSPWMQVALDVLDQAMMPAVDSPGSPGFSYAQLAGLSSALCASGHIVGINFTIYDPERDPHARYARSLVDCIVDSLRGRAGNGKRTIT